MLKKKEFEKLLNNVSEMSKWYWNRLLHYSLSPVEEEGQEQIKKENTIRVIAKTRDERELYWTHFGGLGK